MHRIQSTVEELERFFRGQVWADIKSLCGDGIEDGHLELENTELVEQETAFCRGKLSQIREFLGFEHSLIEAKKDQMEEDEEERLSEEPPTEEEEKE